MVQFIKKYDFDSTKVSNIVYEDSYPGYVWIAFESSTPNECRLIKSSTFNLKQLTFDLTCPISRINKMVIDGANLVLAVTDDSLMGYTYNTFNAILSFLAIDKPAGISEEAIDVVASSTRYFFLFPGNTTGNNAQIVVTNKAGTHLQTIDLTPSATGGSPTTEASGMTIDANGDIWVVTNTSPVNLVRVYDTGSEVYDVQSHQIT